MVSQQQSTRCEPNTGKYTAMPETPSSELMQALLSVAQDRDKKAFAYLFEYFSGQNFYLQIISCNYRNIRFTGIFF